MPPELAIEFGDKLDMLKGFCEATRVICSKNKASAAKLAMRRVLKPTDAMRAFCWFM
jgi:hypothetical protein